MDEVGNGERYYAGMRGGGRCKMRVVDEARTRGKVENKMKLGNEAGSEGVFRSCAHFASTIAGTRGRGGK